METQTQGAPASPPAPKFKLAPPRRALRKGLPTEGFILFTGLPKSGKNSLALSIPGLTLLELEKKGSHHLDGWIQDVNDLGEFREAFMAALQDPSCKAIGVSTLDKLIGWWQDEICAHYQVTSMSAQVEGANLWNDLRRYVETLVEKSKVCGKLIVLLAHYKEPKLDKEGRLVVTHNVDAPGKLGSFICSEAELIGACSKAKVGNKMQFKVSFIGGGEIGAYGGRVKELEGKEVVLPDGGQWAAIEALCKEYVPETKAPEAETKAPEKETTTRAASPREQQKAAAGR